MYLNWGHGFNNEYGTSPTGTPSSWRNRDIHGNTCIVPRSSTFAELLSPLPETWANLQNSHKSIIGKNKIMTLSDATHIYHTLGKIKVISIWRNFAPKETKKEKPLRPLCSFQRHNKSDSGFVSEDYRDPYIGLRPRAKQQNHHTQVGHMHRIYKQVCTGHQRLILTKDTILWSSQILALALKSYHTWHSNEIESNVVGKSGPQTMSHQDDTYSFRTLIDTLGHAFLLSELKFLTGHETHQPCILTFSRPNPNPPNDQQQCDLLRLISI
jgi:hypothetical protein